MSVSVLEQAKIQAQVLVPLVKAMQAELGEERANAIVRKALRDLYRRYGEDFWRAKNEENIGKAMTSAFATFARGDALDFEVKEQSQDAFDINVRRCRYAEFYNALGESELGPPFCSADGLHGQGDRAEDQAHRTQTIMQGASDRDLPLPTITSR